VPEDCGNLFLEACGLDVLESEGVADAFVRFHCVEVAACFLESTCHPNGAVSVGSSYFQNLFYLGFFYEGVQKNAHFSGDIPKLFLGFFQFVKNFVHRGGF